MQEVIDFLKAKNVEKTKFFNQLKCSLEEAKILQYLSKEYINGRDVLSTIDILGQFYSIEKYEHLEKLSLIKSLLEYGWLIQVAFDQVKLNEASKLELINSSVALSSAYLKMLESGNSEFVLPEIKNYSDHLEYLQDQFLKIDITQQLNIVKRNFDINSPSSNRLKNKLLLVENRIKDRINATTNKILIEEFFKEQGLDEQEKILFLALLKEELSTPCIEEIAVFKAFAKTVSKAKNSFVVLDTAPTGHTLLLLDASQAYHKEVLKNKNDALEEDLIELLPRIKDEKYTKILLVTLPEATPTHEAKDLQEDLKRAGIKPYAWVINRSFALTNSSNNLLCQKALKEIKYIKGIKDSLSFKTLIKAWDKN